MYSVLLHAGGRLSLSRHAQIAHALRLIHLGPQFRLPRFDPPRGCVVLTGSLCPVFAANAEPHEASREPRGIYVHGDGADGGSSGLQLHSDVIPEYLCG